MPSRRRFLAVSAAGLGAALAGCPGLEPGGALSMTAAESDAKIARQATEVIDPELDRDMAAVFERILDANHAEVEADRPPLDPDRPVAYRNNVYEVDWESLGERTTTRHVVRVRFGTDDIGEPEVDYEELPEIDRTALSDLQEISRREAEREDRPDEPLETELDYYRFSDEELESSALVPEAEYDVVGVDGFSFAVEPRQRDVTLTTFGYSAAMAGTLEEFGAELREARLFALAGLDSDERELVEEAIEEGRVVVGTDDDAFVGVGNRLLEEEPIYIERRVGEWLVEYEAENYWAELDTLRTRELVEQLEAYEETPPA